MVGFSFFSAVYIAVLVALVVLVIVLILALIRLAYAARATLLATTRLQELRADLLLADGGGATDVPTDDSVA
ncbi:hypothetical protein [Planctomonas psychrotolerans]|uniref:hypothetical protein n=1 Tax=Planctomonas psychrotolerans TaxID=2528712 RepID=UPI0012390DAD|nr:hypothetical protein [Planctomonas psychrotolerans]